MIKIKNNPKQILSSGKIIDNNKVILESLAMDLKRVSMGYHRNSIKMAERFYEEALKRKNEVNTVTIAPYMKKILEDIERLGTDKTKIAEDSQMLSTLIQNYTKFSSI